MHVALYQNDARGDLVDVIYVCSDACHRDYCDRTEIPYLGWDGCHEGPDYLVYCEQCGVRCNVGDTDAADHCTGECLPVVVNLIAGDEADRCEHGVSQYLRPTHLPMGGASA